jgi:hypothetical protein
VRILRPRAWTSQSDDPDSDYLIVGEKQSPSKFIPKTDVTRTYYKAYRRMFQVKPEAVASADVKVGRESA